MRGERGLRIGIAVVAILAIAWLAIMERDRRLLASGTKAAGSIEGPQQAARARRDLSGAELLNPDRTPEIGQAVVDGYSGRADRAATTLERVVRAEPDNLLAWRVLYGAVRRTDPVKARRALDMQRRLDPVRARSR